MNTNVLCVKFFVIVCRAYLAIITISSCVTYDDHSRLYHDRGNNSSMKNLLKEKITTNLKPPLHYQRSYSGRPDIRDNKIVYTNGQKDVLVSKFSIYRSLDMLENSVIIGIESTDNSKVSKSETKLFSKQLNVENTVSERIAETSAEAGHIWRTPTVDSVIDEVVSQTEFRSPVLESPLLQTREELKSSPHILESHMLQTSEVLKSSSHILESRLLQTHGILESSSHILESHMLQTSGVLESSYHILESHMLQTSGVLESSSPILESYLYEMIDEVWDSTWYTPPINYYKCGRCTCYKNGSSVHANCDQQDFWDIPDNLSTNTNYMSFRKNRIQLEFFTLTRYTSLQALDISSNRIFRIQNNTCNETLILHTLNLTDNKIWTIDDNSFSCLPNLKYLYLQYNNIQMTRYLMFAGIDNLLHLDLSHNLLSALESNTFETSPNLRELILSHNKNLTYSSKLISIQLFRPLKQLETLHIQGFKKFSTHYPISALLQLRNLKELNIDGALRQTFEVNLTTLKNLSVVNIGGYGQCGIHNLSDNYFIGLPYLRSIHLSGCRPKYISPVAFQTIQKLEILKYTNIYYEFDSLFESLSGLQNTRIKSLTINGIQKYSKLTACRYLGAQHARNMKNMTHLQELNLEENAISLIQYDFFQNLPITLEKLNLRKNTLNYLRSTIMDGALSHLKNLIELREDMQNRAIFFGFHQASDDSSEIRNMACKLETRFAQPTTSAPSSTYVTNVAKQTIHKPSSRYANSFAENINVSSSLQYILPPNLQVYSAFDSFNFGSFLLLRSKKREQAKNRIRYINASNNYITDWGNRKMPHQVEIADLSNNYCDDLKISFVRANNSLKELHAAGNFFGDVFSRDEQGDILSRLHSLRYLDLSRNHIHYLPSRFFVGLFNVQVLILSNNNIPFLDVIMSHMTSLRFLDLSHNSISWINRQTRDDFDFLNLHHELSIDLTSNSLSCTCAGMEVLQWLATTKVTLLNKDFLECVNDANIKELIGDLQNRFISLQRKCATKSVIILVAVFSIVLFVIVISASWMFKNRWRLHYLRNKMIAKYFCYKPHNENEGQRYKYDAYILYSEEDLHFVTNECLNELELKRGHKLCFEHRDFMFGSYLPCAITSAINYSRMTIPILTSDFWDSELCDYGVHIAVVESVYTKRDVLHVLMYKPVETDVIPLSIINILRDNRFCEYPPESCDGSVKKAFWDELSRVIGHVNSKDADLVNVNADLETE